MTEPHDVLLAATLAAGELYKQAHPEARDWQVVSPLCGGPRLRASRVGMRHCYVADLSAVPRWYADRVLLVMRKTIEKSTLGGQLVMLDSPHGVTPLSTPFCPDGGGVRRQSAATVPHAPAGG